MSKRYNEIMEKIEVTPEMRTRILNNISVKNPKMSAVSRSHKFFLLKRYVPLAACFALIIAASYFMPTLKTGKQAEHSEITQLSDDIKEFHSAKELSQAIGFYVPEPGKLPFVSDSTVYTSFWGDMAEIKYMSGEKELIFRKALGTEDNSGDYSEYKNKTEITIGSLKVLLKGNNSGYSLAVWDDGEFSYSIYISYEVSENEWKDIIEGVHP